MVGSAIVRRLVQEDCAAILVAERHALDLRDRHAVDAWLEAHKPDAIFLAGGAPAAFSSTYSNRRRSSSTMSRSQRT
jgi:GDP-L-fucose synthase